jgi:parvulin-like peptidyl-prolyl isomerase
MVSKRGWHVLAGGLILALSVVSVSAQGPGGKVAAKVNGEDIPMSDLQTLLKSRPPSPVVLTDAQKHEMEKAALEMIIEDVLMRQFLKKNVPPANAADITKEFTELKDALSKQKPAKTIQEFLKEGGQTEEQLKADIGARLQWKAYLVQKLPDTTLKPYYDKNKLFFDKVMVKASHILVKVKTDATTTEKQAAQARIQAIRQEIVAGKIKFEDAAQKYSDCPSKTKGGDIGFFPYRFAVVQPFADKAFSMKEGDVSDIISTDFGLHIIKVTGRTKEEPSDFQKIKDAVREIYAQDLDLYQSVLNEQRKAAKIEVFVK